MQNVREQLAQRIRSARGYQVFPGYVNYPIAFNVKIYASNYDAMGEAIRDFADCDHSEFARFTDTQIGAAALEHCDTSEARELALDSMRDALKDDEGFAYVPREIGDALGVACDQKLDCKFLFAGRSGGWLLLERFEGRELARLAPEELAALVIDPDAFSAEWCAALLAYLRKCETMFSPETLAHELAWKTGMFLVDGCDKTLDVLEALRPGYKLELAQRTAAAMTYAGATVGVL